jgi:hypothetical protein
MRRWVGAFKPSDEGALVALHFEGDNASVRL